MPVYTIYTHDLSVPSLPLSFPSSYHICKEDLIIDYLIWLIDKYIRSIEIKGMVVFI